LSHNWRYSGDTFTFSRGLGQLASGRVVRTVGMINCWLSTQPTDDLLSFVNWYVMFFVTSGLFNTLAVLNCSHPSSPLVPGVLISRFAMIGDA